MNAARGRLWCRLSLAAFISLLLAGVAVLGAFVAWRSPAVRGAVLARLTAAGEERTGVRVSAEDVELHVWQRRLDLVGVRAGVPDGPPFLTIERLTVQLEVASLRRKELVLRLLRLEAPHLDLSAPLPAFPTSPAASEGTQLPPAAVAKFVIVGGSVTAGELPAALRPYLAGWGVSGVELQGSYLAGVARAEVRIAEIALRRPGVARQSFALAVSGEATPGGAWQVKRAVLHGEGLEAEATASGSFAPGGEQHVSLRLTAAPDVVAPELHLGGKLRLAGEFHLPQGRGHVRLNVTGLSAQAAARLLPTPPPESLALAGTEVDLAASVTLPPSAEATAFGDATVAFRRGAEELLRLSLHGDLRGSAVQAQLDAVLLPRLPGQRRVRGHVVLDDLFDPRAARLRDVRLELDERDVAAAVDELRRRWPALVPEVPPGVPLRGGVKLRAHLHGPAADPKVEATLLWRLAEGQQVEAVWRGRAAALAGEAEVRVTALELAPLFSGFGGTVSARVHLKGSPQAYTARFALDGAALGAGATRVDYLHVAGETDGRELRLHRVAALAGRRVAQGALRAALAVPLTDAEAEFILRDPSPAVAEVQVRARLQDGVVELEVPRAETVAGWARLSASVPLGTLRPLLGELMDRLPVQQRDGPLFGQLSLPALDSCRLAALLPQLDRPERLRAGLDLTLLVDPARPTGATGEVILTSAQVDGYGTRLGEAVKLRVVVDGHRAVLAPVAVTAAGTTLEVAGEASLAPTWRPGVDAPAGAVTGFSARARGTVEAALLQPYLAGAAAAGPVDVEARLYGTPAAPRAAITVDARGATFFWPTPYATRLDGVAADAGITAAGDVLFSASGNLNGGHLEVVGSRTADGRSEAQVELQGSRFRLDFGVLVQLGGELVVELPPEGRSRVYGTLNVARGRLDRPLSLRHELLPFLLAPPTTAGTAGGELDLVDLEIAVRTEDGVRVRNNLADVRVRWDDLFIRGTAWSPHLEGVVTVDPGGLVRAWGQTLRLDRAVATFTGDPLNDPHLELSVTSSLDDPAVGRAASGALALLDSNDTTGGTTVETALTMAAAGAVGETLASSLSSSLGDTARITVEPVLVFGETDPSAHLTITRDVSPEVAFAVSLDLRNAGRQTYLVNLHNLPQLPTLSAQLFTNDAGASGVTLQQALELGGSRRRDDSPRPALRRVTIEAPAELPRHRLRRAIPLARGDVVWEGVELDLELELEHFLRQLGYPDGQVNITATPVAGRRPRVDLHVEVVPGAPVAVVFVGESPPAGARPLVTSLYRPGLWEPAALEEMRRAAVRVWRSLGYVDPAVTVTAAAATAQQPRTVTVHSVPGQRLEKLHELRVAGVPNDVEEQVRAAFAGTVELMELAAGLPDADQRLTATMAALGYPASRVLARRLSDEASQLTVEVAPGPRQHLTEVRITGARDTDVATLLDVAGLAAGDAARRDEATAAAVRIAEWYRSRGYPDVQVRPVLAPSPDDPLATTLSFEVSPGQAFTVGAVELAGAPRTSPALARRVAAVPTGEPLRLAAVRGGRRRLLATGLYAGVGEEVRRGEDGSAIVRYLLDERPPVSLAYGVRWESGGRAAAVVDYVDRNLLGRALTFGGRALYESDTHTGRLYLGAPDVLGSGVRTEGFVERRRRITPGDDFLPELVEDLTRFTFQLSRPLGGRWVLRAYGRWQRIHLFERSDFFPLDITLTLPYVGVGAAFDSRDDRVLAHRGLLANIDLSGTNSALGADIAFGRLFAQFTSFVPAGRLAGRSLTLASSLRLGLAATGSGEELIRSERFFAGGEFSVRGYPTDSLGPQEDLGFTRRPLGGEALLVLNQELRAALPLDLTGVVFVDAGGVWPSASHIDLRELVLSVGAGVRAATPIGVLRLDAALPLDRRPDDPSFKLYLGFGSVL